jgi:hypothetical protein
MTDGNRPSEEEEAAAREAGAIGGPNPDPDIDPAERPLRESGEGESEGFELAEEELRRNAEHDDPAGSPMLDRFPDEEQSGAVYGDADEEPSDARDESGDTDDDDR